MVFDPYVGSGAEALAVTAACRFWVAETLSPLLPICWRVYVLAAAACC